MQVFNGAPGLVLTGISSCPAGELDVFVNIVIHVHLYLEQTSDELAVELLPQVSDLDLAVGRSVGQDDGGAHQMADALGLEPFQPRLG